MLKLEILVIALLVHNAISYVAIERQNIIISVDSITKNVKNVVHHTNPINRPTDHAKVARKLVHKSNWAATGTISTQEQIKGFPMVNIISIADSGKDELSTGHIYYYLTMMDFTGQDYKQDNKITFMMSDDQDFACSRNNTDPMEPTCARVIISGKVIEMVDGTEEYSIAAKIFESRHPAVEKWLKAHSFFLCTVDITSILVLDWYGGPHSVSAEDYYKVTPE